MNIGFYILSWIVVYSTLIFKIALPFFRFNNLDIWDTSSHFQAIWFVKNFIFPGYTGWNPFAFAGFPQNLFYPPLFHYLGAFISCFFPIAISLKILIIGPILLLPVAVYLYLRSLDMNINDSLIVLFYYLFSLFIFGDKIGGSLEATFNNGLLVNNFSLFLFFLFLFSLQKKYFVRSILFFSAIIITHLPTAFVSVISFIIFWFIDRQNSKKYTFILIFTFLITSFWTIPFFVFRQEMMIGFLEGINYGTLLIFFILSLFLIYHVPKAKAEWVLVLGLVIICFIISIIKFPQIHLYRVLAYVYWFIPLCLYYLKKSFGFRYSTRYLILIIFIYLFFAAFQNFKPVSPYSFNFELKEKYNDKRILMNYEIPHPLLLPHYINDQIPVSYGNIPASGLFMESSLNSFYIIRLQYQLSTNNFVWGINASEFMDTVYLPMDSDRLFDLYHINYTLNYKKECDQLSENDKIIAYVPDMSALGKNKKNCLILTEVSNNQLIEPVASIMPVSLFGEEWNKAVRNWFFHKSLPDILIQTNDRLPNFTTLPENKELIHLKYISKNQDTIRFEVNSSYQIPILVKISYFPKWKASADKKPINIYRASPNLMLVYAKGDIELKYEDMRFEIFLRYVSLISFIFLIIYGFKFLLSLKRSKHSGKTQKHQ